MKNDEAQNELGIQENPPTHPGTVPPEVVGANLTHDPTFQGFRFGEGAGSGPISDPRAPADVSIITRYPLPAQPRERAITWDSPQFLGGFDSVPIDVDRPTLLVANRWTQVNGSPPSAIETDLAGNVHFTYAPHRAIETPGTVDVNEPFPGLKSASRAIFLSSPGRWWLSIMHEGSETGTNTIIFDEFDVTNPDDFAFQVAATRGACNSRETHLASAGAASSVLLGLNHTLAAKRLIITNENETTGDDIARLNWAATASGVSGFALLQGEKLILEHDAIPISVLSCIRNGAVDVAISIERYF